MSTAPTGEQFEIAAGGYRAIVTEQGAALRVLEHEGDALLDGFDRHAIPDGGRGQVLAPWPNRLRDGRWRWGEHELQLPVDDPDRGNSASHGLVRWCSWQVEEHGHDRVVLTTSILARPGYPFAVALRCEYRLEPDSGLTASIRARNIGEEPAPVALGAHPYLQPAGDLGRAKLRLAAETALIASPDHAPARQHPVTGSDLDFSRPRALDDLALNHTLTGLHRDASGRVTASLSETGRRLEWWAGRDCRWVQVYTGDTLDDPARRRRSIAIEPMTAPPQALATGIGVTVLAPGEALDLEWGLRVESEPPLR